MALRINYDGSNNILFITALTISSTKEGIAVDALRVIFQNLYEATERLEKKLIAISMGMVGLDDSRAETHVVYSSLVGDIWAIIDGIRRLQLILKHIPNLPAKINKDLNQIFDKIKSVRDSFQHIDERIDQHFDIIGGSVYGEIFWRHRERKDIPEVLHCLISGVSRVSRDLQINPNLELPHHAQNIGVYDLELIYIKKDYRKTGTHSKVKINIDGTVDCINSLIDYMEDRYSRFIENSDKTEKAEGSDPTIYQTRAMTCDPPRIYRFKATLEGYLRITQNRNTSLKS